MWPKGTCGVFGSQAECCLEALQEIAEEMCLLGFQTQENLRKEIFIQGVSAGANSVYQPESHMLDPTSSRAEWRSESKANSLSHHSSFLKPEAESFNSRGGKKLQEMSVGSE